MKITLKSAASIGTVQVDPGEYLVSARTDVVAIQLVGRGKDYLLPAIKRPAPRGKKPARSTSVSFYSLGGGQWSLVLTVPKHGEFLCTLKYEEKGLATSSSKEKAAIVYDLDKAMKAKHETAADSKDSEKPASGPKRK